MKLCENRKCKKEHNERSKYCSIECRTAEQNNLRIDRLNSRFDGMTEGYDYLVCPECSQKVVEIVNSHCAMHGCTTDEFKRKHNLEYLQCGSKRENFKNYNPWKDHGGKCSPFSKNNPNYNKDWHEQFAKEHSERQTGSVSNPFCREYYDSDSDYRKAQATFTLEKCIETLGEEEGTRRWKERQGKWQDTLTSKSQEEIDRINKSKFSGGGYSQNSQDLFNLVLNNITEEYKNEIRFATNGGEYRQKLNSGKHISFDFKFRNKIIEFSGDLWHANPRKFKPEDKPLESKFFGNQTTAKEIWDKDEKRFNEVQQLGYEVLIIWEMDYKKDPEGALKQCLDFLKEGGNISEVFAGV